MFCRKCGTELRDGTKFCPQCGGLVTNHQNHDENMRIGIKSATVQQSPHVTTKNTGKRRTTLKLLLVIGLACFFFPFVTVSCSDEEVDISGIEAMTCITSEDSPDLSDYTPNLYLLIAFALGLIGIIVARKNRPVKASGIASAIGAVFLWIFRLTFVSFYELEEYIDAIDIEFGWGWVLALLSFIAAAGVALLPDVWMYVSPNIRLSNNTALSGTASPLEESVPYSECTDSPPE